jgi:hypothetical protein
MVSINDVKKLHGGTLLSKFYGNSLVMALQSVYPQHQWNPYRFLYIPKKHWDDPKDQREFFEWLAKTQGFTNFEDWYSLTLEIIEKYGGGPLIYKYNYSPAKALQTLYPQHAWKEFKFNRVTKGYWEK